MKKIILITAFFGLILTSCQKNKEDQFFMQTTNISADSTSKVSNWQTVGLSSLGQDGTGAKQSAALIHEEAVSSNILENGLVLAYGRQNGNIFLLPTTVAGINFGLEVASTSLILQLSSTDALPESLDVQYVVLSPSQIAEVEEKGIAREELVNLPYAQAQVLFSLP